MTATSRKNRLPKTKTPEEWRLFFECIDTRFPTAARNHAICSLMYQVGLRCGEALYLRVNDVDFERMKLHVPLEGKSGERNVPLPDDDELRRTFERWLHVRAEWKPDSDLLFVTKAGMPIRSSAVRRSMKLYGERSGIGAVHPHMLRHSCATELLANGASLIGVSRVLGHRRLSTTASVYAHAADCHAGEAMLRRGSYRG